MPRGGKLAGDIIRAAQTVTVLQIKNPIALQIAQSLFLRIGPDLTRAIDKMIASANASRHSYAPDTATVQEQGYDIYVDPWFYIAAPAGVPDDAKAALHDAITAALSSDAAKEAIMNAMHTEQSMAGPDETRAMLDAGLTNVGTLFGK